MRILLTNDDGIDAPGLHALREIAKQLSDDVWVSAPETNKSGAGHSLSLHEPLRMRRVDDKAFAVRGTPTDSVIMGVRHVLKDKRPDLILSGVNRGGNLAEDVTYSGTIAGAFEGTLIGIRSIALSQSFGKNYNDQVRWETAIQHGPETIKKLLSLEWQPGTLMNVNFPDEAPADVKGTLSTRQGRRDMNLLSVDERNDTWGNPYYWFNFERRRSQTTEDTDLWAVYNGFISVTALSMNLTHDATHAKLADLFAKK
ncbi:MAG: 5'/3'-nucleotidase SurE [Hyphomicrobiaceae bacterium]|nr:5'/3'-nucleotidase SurE [Hyphomicrobiaceae bacterium]